MAADGSNGRKKNIPIYYVFVFKKIVRTGNINKSVGMYKRERPGRVEI